MNRITPQYRYIQRALLSRFSPTILSSSFNVNQRCMNTSSIFHKSVYGSRDTYNLTRTLCNQAPKNWQDNVQGNEWPEHEFTTIAESCLEHICEVVSHFGYSDSEQQNGPSDFDVELSQGVLTISLGDRGIYVLNTQTPNRQIWLSSPTSGPWRYGWNEQDHQWISTRDGHHLSNRLTNELSIIFNQSIHINFHHLTE